MTALRQVRRLTSTTAACLVLVVGPAQLASAQEGGHRAGVSFDDQEVVQLTSGGSRWTTGLAYHDTGADAVTATNAAVAYAACDGCRAVSLSFQVIVADGAPTAIDVGNLAVAMTENCTGCESVAVAYQLVLAGDRRLRLTSQGWRELLDLRRELRLLARSGLPPVEIESHADALMTQVSATLADELRVRPRIRRDRAHDSRPAAQRPRAASQHERPTQHAS
jgi:hypothetical protein